MAHAIVEWTDNLAADGFEVRPLLALIAARMRGAGKVFPIGGIRIRGVRLTDYVIADDAGGDAFVNIDVRMAAGRDPVWRQAFFDNLFAEIRDHLAPLVGDRPFALSLYVTETDNAHSWKCNTIHARLKKD